MRSRFLAAGAAFWTIGYAAIYLVVISRQGNPPAWWYVALLAVSTGMLTVAAAGLAPRPILIVAAVGLAVGALAGVLSIGVLLIPAVVAAAAAAGGRSPRRQSGQPAR